MRPVARALLATTSLLVTTMLASPALAGEPGPLPDPGKLCGGLPVKAGCDASTLCAQVAANTGQRFAAKDCEGFLCYQVNQVDPTPQKDPTQCSASETLCHDVSPVYQKRVVPVAGGAADDLLDLLGNTPVTPPGTIVRNVLVRAAFYCDPPEPGNGTGSGCQEVVTSDVGRVGARDFVFHDPGLGPTPLANGSDCAWLSSGFATPLWAATDGWTKNVVDLGAPGSDCQTKVRATLSAPALGITNHREDVRVVYC